MSGERSFLNLFRDSRTPLDSIRNKLVTLIYFVIVQCPSVGTTWYSARDLRLPRRTSGSSLSADCQTLDVFLTTAVSFLRYIIREESFRLFRLLWHFFLMRKGSSPFILHEFWYVYSNSLVLLGVRKR